MTAQKSFAVIKPKFNGFVPGALKSWQGSSTGRLNWILIILALLNVLALSLLMILNQG